MRRPDANSAEAGGDGPGAATAASDSELLGRFLGEAGADAEAAFADLVERHGPMVLRVCRRALRDPGDVEDAFQATFLALARRACTVRDGAALDAWLRRVARRVAAHANADAARRREVERHAATLAGAPGPPRRAGAAPAAPAVLEEVGRLPDRFRLPVVLCHLEQLTHAEAACRLGWAERTLRRRLAEARCLLRVRLA